MVYENNIAWNIFVVELSIRVNVDSSHFLKTRLTRFRRLEVRLLKRSSPCSQCNTLEYKRSDKILSEGGGRGSPWIAARKGQTKPGFSSVIFVRLLSVDSLATPWWWRPLSAACVQRYYCCTANSLLFFFFSLSLPPPSI